MNEQSVDHNTRYQSLSALADGEATASEVTEACANWCDDDGARQVWASYQLIGDVLRSEELASTAQHDHFLSKLRQRLADEPVVLAPQAAAQVAAAAQPSAAPMTPARSRRWSGPLAVAASFVAILAGVLTLQGQWATTPGASNLAMSQGGASSALQPSSGGAMALVGAVPVNAGLAWGPAGEPMAKSFSAQATRTSVLADGAIAESPMSAVGADATPTDLVWMIR